MITLQIDVSRQNCKFPFGWWKERKISADEREKLFIPFQIIFLAKLHLISSSSKELNAGKVGSLLV